MNHEEAFQKQEEYMQKFGTADWDVYRQNEIQVLYKKVGLAIFGLPVNGCEYEKEQRDHIKQLTRTIITEDVHEDADGGETWMSVIMLLVKRPENSVYYHPVFRVPRYENGTYGQHTFIDCTGRVYKNWDDFLENNKLSQSEICYPQDGVYSQSESDQVMIQFKSNKSNKVLGAADAISNTVARVSLGVALGAVALSGASSLVKAALVGATISGLYKGTRVIQDKVDRSTHGESVGLFDTKFFRICASVVTGFWRAGSAAKGFNSTSNHSESTLVGVAFRSAISITRLTVTPQTMFRNVDSRELFVQDVPAYALLFCHTAVSRTQISHYICDNRQQESLFKSATNERTQSNMRLRYLVYVGEEDEVLREISECSLYGNCETPTFFLWTLNIFGNIYDNVEDCFQKTLTLEWVGNTITDIKVIIDFFNKHCLPWAVDTTKKIVRRLNSREIQTACIIMSQFYNFVKDVIDKSSTNGIAFSANGMLEILQICVDRHDDFYTKFTQLCQDSIEPGFSTTSVDPPEPGSSTTSADVAVVEEAIRPDIGDGDILYAASAKVGSLLTDTNARISRQQSGIFVLISDAEIEFTVLQIVGEKGNLTAITAAGERNTETFKC